LHKIFLILKIVHTRQDVSSRQLPPYSNSGKLPTTDILHTRFNTREQLFSQQNHTVCTARCLDINCGHARALHVLTSSRDA